jgi:hypothetical protein
MKFVLFHVFTVGCLIVAGCADTPPKTSAKPTIAGRWVAAAEKASVPTTMTFQDSGVFQYKGPLLLRGKPANVEGRSQAATLIASGSWETTGSGLHVQITQASDYRLAINQPWEFRVVRLTDKELVLKREGEEGETVTLVRGP